MKYEKTKKLMIVGILLGIIVLIVLLICLFERKKNTKDLSNIDIQEYITLNKEDKHNISYTIDLNKACEDNKLSGLSILEENDISFKFKLNDYDIQLKLKDNNYLCDTSSYKVYVNDKYIYDDTVYKRTIKIDSLGQYLIFRNNDCTDIRCNQIVIVDNNGNITTLYELDNVKGLVATSYTISDDKITVNATRTTYNGAIIYNNKQYDVYYEEDCENITNILSKNILIKATYTYKYNNGVLDLTPEITNTVTLDEYLKDKNNCISTNNTDTDKKATISQINSFLISDNFISKSDVIAETLPDGYVFLDNGKFAYYNPSFHVRFVEDEQNRIISFIGTWSIDTNKLILNVEKEEYAVGGEINSTPAGNYLQNYTRKVNEVNKTFEYIVNKIDNTNEHLPFISLSLDNNETKWYSLPGVGEYINIPRTLAKNGYNETYYQLVK